MHVITVEFTLRREHVESFMPAMRENARASLAEEPGCLQFDVCVDPEDPARVFLYEVYADAAAFRAHLAAPHFKAFDAAVGPWVASKAVRTLTRVVPG